MLIGGNGSDYCSGDSGNYTINGGVGNDTANYTDNGFDAAGVSTYGVTVNLATGTASLPSRLEVRRRRPIHRVERRQQR